MAAARFPAARFPIYRSLADFDFSQSKVDESLIQQLATFDFTAHFAQRDRSFRESVTDLGMLHE